MITLGIDASTQSVSALVYNTTTEKVLTEKSVNFGERLPEYQSPQGFLNLGNGVVHANPLMWLDALEICLQELSDTFDLSLIEGISGAGQQHGSVYLNEKWFSCIQKLDTNKNLSTQISPCLSRKTSPIWMDTSTTEECREIEETVGGATELCQRTGSIGIERFTAAQIRKFYKQEPDAYHQTERVHLVSSFLCSVLCGADCSIDFGDGAGMNLWNLHTQTWDEDLVRATAPDLGKKLPLVKASTTRAGTLSPYFSEKYGFSTLVPITLFTGDNPSSLVGMQATEPGKVVISLGTSDTFFAALTEPLTDPAGCGHVFGNPAGGFMTLQCFMNGSLAREKVRDFCEYDWEQFSQALRETPVGNNGNTMKPFFVDEISPRISDAKPVLCGSPDFEAWKDKAALVRACVEGQAHNMKACTAWMKLSPKTIYLTGGASQNKEIQKVLAEVFSCSIETLDVSNSVALGAAMRASY